MFRIWVCARPSRQGPAVSTPVGPRAPRVTVARRPTRRIQQEVLPVLASQQSRSGCVTRAQKSQTASRWRFASSLPRETASVRTRSGWRDERRGSSSHRIDAARGVAARGMRQRARSSRRAASRASCCRERGATAAAPAARTYTGSSNTALPCARMTRSRGGNTAFIDADEISARRMLAATVSASMALALSARSLA
eukprot:scaffold31709_cov118-Isochrysis_galbana.AAC.4